MPHLTLSPTETHIIQTLNNQGYKVWAVGGCIRDLELGYVPKDNDFVTDCRIEELIQLFPNHIPDHTAIEHAILRIPDHDTGSVIDLAQLRSDIRYTGESRNAKVVYTSDVYKDLDRRDFYINAMACEIDPSGSLGPIIDLDGRGSRDINNLCVQFVGHAHIRIEEDPLRMLRACRFLALHTEMQLDSDTARAIKIDNHKIQRVSRERISSEIFKAMSYPHPDKFWAAIAETGLARYFAPFIFDMNICNQNKHHDFETVLEHSLRCLKVGKTLTNDPMLRLAIFLHDVGKPTTAKIIDGDVTFYSHEVEGTKIVYEWMMNLRFSKEEALRVSTLVRHHQWRFEENSKDNTIRRWLKEVGKDTWNDLWIIRQADRAGNRTKMYKPPLTKEMISLKNKIDRIIHETPALSHSDLPVNGNDLIELGVKPGPIYKQIFDELLSITFNDPKKCTREYLLEHVRSHYASN